MGVNSSGPKTWENSIRENLYQILMWVETEIKYSQTCIKRSPFLDQETVSL